MFLAQRTLRRVKGRQRKLERAAERDVELGVAAGTVHNHRDAGHVAAEGADQVDRLLNPSPLGHHVFGDQHFFARTDGEAALQHEVPVFLVGEDGADAEGAGDLLPDDETADRRGDYRFDPLALELFGEEPADGFGLVRILQEQRRLEETIAVQPAAKLEVTGQQGAGVFQNSDDFLFCHDRVFFPVIVKFFQPYSSKKQTPALLRRTCHPAGSCRRMRTFRPPVCLHVPLSGTYPARPVPPRGGNPPCGRRPQE